MSCICGDLPDRYDRLHEKLHAEMKIPVSIDDIVNHDYCVSTISLPTNDDFNIFNLTPNQVFEGLNNETGVYHLWEEVDYCADHPDQVKIRCTYVGETGNSIKNRVAGEHLNKNHRNKKWDENTEMWVMFYPCKKRIAVYLEQLLLDVYSFEQNKEGNKGTIDLEVFYPKNILSLGTSAYEIADMFARKYPDVFDEPDTC